MKELMSSEFLRMKSRKKNKICLAVLLVSFVFNTLWDKISFLGGNTEFYTPSVSASVNALNFPLFSMKNLIVLLFIIILPILFIDSLSGEYESGAYRLIAIRPYTKTQLWISKLMVQSILTAVILLGFFLIATLTGHLFFNKVPTTTFYTSDTLYNAKGALIYNFRAVILMYLVSNAILGLSAVIASFLPKVIPAIIFLLGVLIGGMYVNNAFEVLVFPVDKIVRLLSLGERLEFYIPVVGCLIIGTISSLIIFNRKDLRV